MAEVQPVRRDWCGTVTVAASGPGLTESVASVCEAARSAGRCRIVVVNDAWRRLPQAEILYACDDAWWDIHRGAPDFAGEKWSSHDCDGGVSNDKSVVADKYGLRLVCGAQLSGFSRDVSRIHYGHNSGFQAVNLAILKGAERIVLVGFDMRYVGDLKHFFGDHPPGLRQPMFDNFIEAFRSACPPPVPILNATPGSALKCFPMVDLTEELNRV